MCVCAQSLQSCLTLCDPMDYSTPGSSANRSLQARIVEWVAMPFSRESSWSRSWTWVSCISCIAKQILYHWATREILAVLLRSANWCATGKESTCQCRRHKRCRFSPWVRKIPWRRKWQPTLLFLPGEFHGQRCLAGYSSWGHKQSNTAEHSTQNQDRKDSTGSVLWGESYQGRIILRCLQR